MILQPIDEWRKRVSIVNDFRMRNTFCLGNTRQNMTEFTLVANTTSKLIKLSSFFPWSYSSSSSSWLVVMNENMFPVTHKQNGVVVSCWIRSMDSFMKERTDFTSRWFSSRSSLTIWLSRVFGSMIPVERPILIAVLGLSPVIIHTLIPHWRRYYLLVYSREW